ncbi:MAG TPA: potassium transporter Trk [Clostridium sp.]|nr:potassium transporter Trk [Clostridium sp.]
MNKKQFIVIGLGRFGCSLAKTVSQLGNDVLAIDKDEERVQEIADHVTHAIQMDATDETVLQNIGIRNFDIAVVSISDVQENIMASLLIKEMGVKYIIATAHNEKHKRVLSKIGVDKVILAEQDMGIRVAHNLVSSNILDYIELSSEYSIMEVEALDAWIGKTLKDLALRKKYGINVVAIKNSKSVNVSPSADDIVNEGDVVVALGAVKTLSDFEKLLLQR